MGCRCTGLILVLLLASMPPLSTAQTVSGIPATKFSRVKIGGGGYVVDIETSPDGLTRLIRTDVHGGYIWNDKTASWDQLVTSTSMPRTEAVLGNGGSGSGVYALGVAPSLSSRLYMVYPGITDLPSTVYRSDNRGATWTKTNLQPVTMTVQAPGRIFGPKMAIDPLNPDVVYLGDTAGKIHFTLDGGSKWGEISTSAVPAGAEPAIVFDRTSGTTGGRTNTIFVATGANGVYRSANSGLTWARTAGGPNSVRRLSGAFNGRVYATDNDRASAQNAWTYSADVWARMSPFSSGQGNGWHSIAVEPQNTKHVVLGMEAGNIDSSFDAGVTWVGHYANASDRVAADVPWLTWTHEHWMSNGNMEFDPVAPNKLYFAEGIGLWHTSPRSNAGRPTWTSETAGIEELIVNDLIIPPGGAPLVAVQDRGVFRISDPEVYPTDHGPARDVPIRHGWAVDYASSEPAFTAGIFNGGGADKSGYSHDGGLKWVPFGSNAPASPPGNLGGSIAVSTPKNMVWAPANNGRPFYTLDGGIAWVLCDFPADLPTSGELGWSFSMYQNRHIFVADRVLPNTFYAYNYGPEGSPGVAGTYKSVDSGRNWTKVGAGFGVPGSMGTSARLASVPGHAGHLFFAIGTTSATQSHPYNVPLKRSMNGGVTWNDVSNTQEAWAVGFGQPAPGQLYPALYMAGYANGDPSPGIYRSDDNCVTWTKLTSSPAGSLDLIRAVTGDMKVYGSVYLGSAGSGAVYGLLQDR
jgi:photosystem II stability/assembly factor-like uncharacterized protein